MTNDGVKTIELALTESPKRGPYGLGYDFFFEITKAASRALSAQRGAPMSRAPDARIPLLGAFLCKGHGRLRSVVSANTSRLRCCRLRV